MQTEADRAAQRCIIASLHKQFPKVAIIGEEVHEFLSQSKIKSPYSCVILFEV